MLSVNITKASPDWRKMFVIYTQKSHDIFKNKEIQLREVPTWESDLRYCVKKAMLPYILPRK